MGFNSLQFIFIIYVEDSLLALLENPFLISASSSLKATRERRFSLSGESGTVRSKWVYVFQREYATVDHAHADNPDQLRKVGRAEPTNFRNSMTWDGIMWTPILFYLIYAIKTISW